MRRLLLLAAAVAGALLLAFWASQPPSSVSASAPATAFSAERALADVREVARAPHPTGSAENARVREYLLGRMRGMGLATGTQDVALGKKGVARLKKWGDPKAASVRPVNLIGLLPGRDRAQPALLLMAHYDSVWGSPGAADDAAGVAAILEIVRAIQARGGAERDIVILFTDAEELGLDGARGFFGKHPLAKRIGAIANFESRGGGGRALMFETGRGNGAMVDLFRRSASRSTTNSLSVLIYDLMPNSTDFTIAKRKNIQGVNFAFLGRGALYHSPKATSDALDPGTLQHLGDQGLGIAHALAVAQSLPERSDDLVFGDILSLFVIAYPPSVGWLLLGASAVLLGLAFLGARRKGAVTPSQLARGALLGFAIVAGGALLLRALNLVSSAGGASNYYDRLAAQPMLEVQAFLICAAVLLAAGAFSRIRAGWAPGLWGGWLGIALLVFAVATGMQAFQPTGAAFFAWPLLLAAAMAAVAAWTGPALERLPAQMPVAVAGAIGTAQLLYLGHAVFLGVGHSLPEAMAVIVLLVALLLWPLLEGMRVVRRWWIAPAALMLGALVMALWVNLDPVADTIPVYGPDKPAAAGPG